MSIPAYGCCSKNFSRDCLITDLRSSLVNACVFTVCYLNEVVTT